ncbi:hypothetical protein EVAR_84304_1 [Eumeta japonica]|uniref:ATP-dependent DNA helicase n=1 Tax=Eumeta variegata TaxID=151549 RepID=A0A4C2A2H2_EUMVA|nr:hypothetical protein EVAR_84304_1 [Eumeta japonica]
MADGKCTKRYPRPLVAETVTGTMDIQFIVGVQRKITVELSKLKFKIRLRSEMNSLYHTLLSRIFETHANVESCHSAKSIKYLCKYVTKGSDMAVFGIASENANDEISNFQMGRYVSTNEALWRLLSFQIHERYPTVVHLAVHLENGQRVYFTEANAAQRAERPPSTTLTSFAMCEADPFAATLMYVEMPKYYTWNQSTKKFQRRKQGTPVPDWPQVFSTDALGRMYTVHPRNDECFICDCSKQVYETLMQAVDNNTGGLFFLDAPGGTGKTFVISLILATIRSRCDIALALASSGIAATLLDGGRTAHSALKLPLNLNTIDTPTIFPDPVQWENC